VAEGLVEEVAENLGGKRMAAPTSQLAEQCGIVAEEGTDALWDGALRWKTC